MHHRRDLQPQRVLGVVGPPPAGDEVSTNLYLHMFVEDTAQSLVPYDRCQAEAAPKTATREEDDLLAGALAARYYSPRDLTNAVRELARYVASDLLRDGVSLLEVVALQDEKGAARAFALEPIPTWAVKVRPSGTFSGESVESIAGVRIPSDRIVLTLLPRPLRAPVLAIKRAGAQRLSVMEDSRLMARFSEIRGAETALLARATREVGWNVRGLLSEANVSEYFTVERALRFQEYVIQIRTIALASINEGLRKGYELLQKPVREVALSGLPTAEMIQSCREKLSTGGTPFLEILKDSGAV